MRKMKIYHITVSCQLWQAKHVKVNCVSDAHYQRFRYRLLQYTYMNLSITEFFQFYFCDSSHRVTDLLIMLLPFRIHCILLSFTVHHLFSLHYLFSLIGFSKRHIIGVILPNDAYVRASHKHIRVKQSIHHHHRPWFWTSMLDSILQHYY